MASLLDLCLFSGMESTLAEVAELRLHAGKDLHLNSIYLHRQLAQLDFETLGKRLRVDVRTPVRNAMEQMDCEPDSRWQWRFALLLHNGPFRELRLLGY